MVPLAFQSPPAICSPCTAQIRWMVPLARLSFRSSPWAKKATNWPSGDQKARPALSVPASWRALAQLADDTGARQQADFLEALPPALLSVTSQMHDWNKGSFAGSVSEMATGTA